jgi:spore coat polysaccharide biosynthesis protein SpsF
MAFRTEQETFWAGQFGTDYIARNGDELLPFRIRHLAKIMGATSGIRSVIELGANIGLNLRALQAIAPGIQCSAVEINAAACKRLRAIGGVEVLERSILDFQPARTWDLVLVKGVLIHIDPAELARVYDLIYRCAGRYILLDEYFNPAPVEVSYRGHKGKLFKRDFAGELMDARSDLRLVEYGFAWRRDPGLREDDTTWFLLEKR